MQCNILETPTGKYTFVGWNIPLVLAKLVEPTTDDIRGQRWIDTPNGVRSWRFPVFDTYEDAEQYAINRGIDVIEV